MRTAGLTAGAVGARPDSPTSKRALEYLTRESFRVYWTPQAVWWDPRFDPIRDEVRFDRAQERIKRLWSPEWR